MSEIKISVIVPIYNGANFIEYCCQQLSHQTLKQIEIILVNDGSDDNSGAICDKMKKEYDNLIVIHQENQGVSAARNHGIELAKGEYLSFLDVDDEYDDDMLETLFETAVSNDLDTLMMANIGEPNEIHIFESKEAVFKSFLHSKLGISSCCGIYKRSLYPDFSFPVGIMIYEDCMALYKAITCSERVGTINVMKYHYIHREGSSSRALRFTKKYFDAINVVDEIYQSIRETYPELEPSAVRRKNVTYLRIVKIYYLRQAPKEFSMQIKQLKKSLRALNYKQTKQIFDKNDRIRYYLCLYAFPVFWLLVHTIDRN